MRTARWLAAVAIVVFGLIGLLAGSVAACVICVGIALVVKP